MILLDMSNSRPSGCEPPVSVFCCIDFENFAHAINCSFRRISAVIAHVEIGAYIKDNKSE
jgi:hypothetical protein